MEVAVQCRVHQSSWPQTLCGQVISQKLVSPADAKISFEIQAGVWESGLPGMWEDNLATLLKCSCTINHQHLSTTKRNRESNYPFPEKAADHVEKAPDGQSEASTLWDHVRPWYLFPFAFVCFWNTSKMVADDCIRLQNMAGLFAKNHSSGKACDG